MQGVSLCWEPRFPLRPDWKSEKRKLSHTTFTRFLRVMGKYHAEDIRKYYLDTFGFDSSIEESSRKLIELFAGLGVDMYYEDKIIRKQVDGIQCDTELDGNEIFEMISALVRS